MEEQVKSCFNIDVLLCEDNEMNRELVCARLEKLGITPDVAVNGKEGVDMVSKRLQSGKKPYDIVLMDIMMPVMNGLEATVEIRGLCADMPIIAMTPDCTPKEMEKYLGYGMADCLGKPFTMQELRECLSRHAGTSS